MSQHAEDPIEQASTLLRYVEEQDGRMEPQETLLTPEDLLDPKVGDTWFQGRQHFRAVRFLYGLLARWFEGRPDVLLLSELKHMMAPRRRPAPDISVVMGLPDDFDSDITVYKVRAIGIAPSLIIEVLAPYDRRIREVDEVDKVELYERFGVREYLLHDLPTKRNGLRLGWRGYRLDLSGRYAPIEPDAQGRLLSETTGLLFGANPAGSWAAVVDAKTGQHLLSPSEEKEGRLRAEEALRREAKARKVAEAEVTRLREELARLRRKD